MRADDLRAAMLGQLTTARAAQLLEPCERALQAAACTTPARAAMFLAQLGEESGSLHYTEEIASGREYEGRRDLGNFQPGDGPRYKGRSFIQITGRYNYAALSAWAFARDLIPSPRYFLDHPGQLATDRYAFLGAVWYWVHARPELNHYADDHDLEAATRAINGGLNGLEDRRRRWEACLRLGTAILPTAQTAPERGNRLMLGVIRGTITNALRAALLGGDHGHWTAQRYPNLIGSRGLLHRMAAAEKRLTELERPHTAAHPKVEAR